MANGSGGSGSGGVPGAGGVAAPPRNVASGVGAVPANCPVGTVGCPHDNKHWVRAELRYKDDNTPVPWAEGAIVMGTLFINSGPLTFGALQSSDLIAATYSVMFRDIDANEWWEG
jgi:hypothetical protein